MKTLPSAVGRKPYHRHGRTQKAKSYNGQFNILCRIRMCRHRPAAGLRNVPSRGFFLVSSTRRRNSRWTETRTGKALLHRPPRHCTIRFNTRLQPAGPRALGGGRSPAAPHFSAVPMRSAHTGRPSPTAWPRTVWSLGFAATLRSKTLCAADDPGNRSVWAQSEPISCAMIRISKHPAPILVSEGSWGEAETESDPLAYRAGRGDPHRRISSR
jgi:hypothetical protein